MLGGTASRRLPVLLALVLVAGAFAGCIGGDGEATETSEAGDEEVAPAANDTDIATEENATDEQEPILTEQVISFQGSGTGVGTTLTGSNFWIIGQGIIQDASFPDTFESGTLTFSWESTESMGGMWVWIRDDSQESVHVFQADSSPLEVQLETDDERLQGAAEIVVIPDQGMPATAHVEAAWSGEFSLMVPSTAGAS